MVKRGKFPHLINSLEFISKGYIKGQTCTFANVTLKGKYVYIVFADIVHLLVRKNTTDKKSNMLTNDFVQFYSLPELVQYFTDSVIWYFS